jgi:hypothetical protein
LKVVITSIVLKNPLKIFAFAFYVSKIVKQLKTSNNIDFKNKGFWTTFYTMTLWENDKDLISFSSSGAHLESMKKSKKIANEIRTFAYDTETLPSWDEAIILLKKGKVIKF